MSAREEFSHGTGNVNVLCVGLACVDFVNVVTNFPDEDSDQRGERYYWQRGGNATNNCTVLTKLSIPCEFMGVLGTKGTEASWIAEDFQRCGISTVHCVRKDVQCSIATVILNRTAGTRTIVYFPRDQPQLSYKEFDEAFKGDFSSYSWIHFEVTSNVSDVCKMINSVFACKCREAPGSDAKKAKTDLLSEEDGETAGCVRSRLGQRPVVSVEVEKPEIAGAEQCMGEADVVFISKDFAKSRGSTDAISAVKDLYSLCKPEAVIICAWGDWGAAACYHDDSAGGLCVVTSPALTDIVVVDSLGAGDSFVAGVIHTLIKKRFRPGVSSELGSIRGENQRKKVLQEAVIFGCKVAGLKCTTFGYEGIRDFMGN